MISVKLPSDILSKYNNESYWKSWKMDHDEDDDYKSWITKNLYQQYKINTEWIIDPIEQYKNGNFDQHYYVDIKKYYSTNTSKMSTSTNLDPFTEYPITNHAWHEYHDGDFSTLIPLPQSITQSRGALELMDQSYRSGTKIYTARSRETRNEDGKIIDPWNRDILSFRDKFNVKLLSRQQTKVEANACDELFIWSVETTLKGAKVLLILWEDVKMSYVQKNIVQKFIDSISPTGIKTDKYYSI